MNAPTPVSPTARLGKITLQVQHAAVAIVPNGGAEGALAELIRDLAYVLGRVLDSPSTPSAPAPSATPRESERAGYVSVGDDRIDFDGWPDDLRAAFGAATSSTTITFDQRWANAKRLGAAISALVARLHSAAASPNARDKDFGNFCYELNKALGYTVGGPMATVELLEAVRELSAAASQGESVESVVNAMHAVYAGDFPIGTPVTVTRRVVAEPQENK